jgi:hypothetical protein
MTSTGMDWTTGTMGKLSDRRTLPYAEEGETGYTAPFFLFNG